MFFNRVKLVAYLQGKSLQLLGEKEGTESLELPVGSIKNSEVTDKEKLKEAIVDFLAKTEIKKQKVILVLGDDVIFQKIIPFTTREELLEKDREFFINTNLDSQSLSKKTLKNGNEVYLIAANRQLYNCVIEAFDAVSWRINYAVPAFVFGIKNNKMEINDSALLLKNGSLIKNSNFLENESKENKTKYIIFGAVFLIIILLVFAVFKLQIFKSFLMGNNDSNINTVILPSSIPTVTADPSRTPTLILVNKKDLKIQILNGTGVPGQAKLVKNNLETLGYTNIFTGNVNNATNTATLVTFSQNISIDNRDEIKTLLKNIFTKVTIQNDINGQYDVVIITGLILP